MDRQTEEILQGLKIAIEAELTGHEFYKNAAKNTADPIKSFFMNRVYAFGCYTTHIPENF